MSSKRNGRGKRRGTRQGSGSARPGDLSRTLEALEGQDWGDPPVQTHVVTTCHRLRRKPLGELTAEELRLAIGQQMSLLHLVPLALSRLREDPLTEAVFYEGDLLESLLRLPTDFWNRQEVWRQKLEEIADQALAPGIGSAAPAMESIVEAWRSFSGKSAPDRR